ncbi:uncharacterized protein BHQ10_007309 [Talaromyces amestolkiae]|uniref:Uncharacterized protein n=1 Tax=Talaromyces amestolkiae TaxID=1196081 RepID=A0A364L654_TALAM|nr:uncharacterized protein BHQ10_007309 [Talaromyces amestolkiae]RAO71297.1 hypothetical protein BHQ10_007309 [Talaromyces amestolkiae]
MPQPQKQQPRRILEKSRTVRRRYQRSNKRLEFSASQIQRIERQEEREKKAKQLREREQKKLANKKKRAEKEAKEREERRRLGIPEPNACKITASQPLLLNFFGAGSKKVDEVRESMEEETEGSEMTQESEASDEDGLIEDAEDESKLDSLSPVQEEEPGVMQPQSQLNKTDDTANCISEEFSDLETELGDDWLDDPELKKHMASIENTQQSLSSSAATHNDQPREPLQGTTNNWTGLTESFEDDTSLMLQALDPTVLEKFEIPQPKVVLSVSQSIKIYPTQNVHRQPHFDAEDEFGDLPLSTQDVRDLDNLVGLG